MRNGVRDGAADLAGRADDALNGDRVTPRRDRHVARHMGTLRQEIADKATASVKEAMGRQTGKQFDMAYLNHQLLSHLYMHAAVEVAAEHAGPELKTALDRRPRQDRGPPQNRP